MMLNIMIFFIVLLLCHEEIQSTSDVTGIQEVNVHIMWGGKAVATSRFNDDFPAINGFAPPSAWHNKEGTGLPQSIWYEFKEALRVVKFSFQSRTEYTPKSIIGAGASKYEFWGSNANDCSKNEGRVVLSEDNSGTPFTPQNNPKVGLVTTPTNYRCYGFTIKETPSKIWASMSNIRLWHDKGHGPPNTELGEPGSEGMREVDVYNMKFGVAKATSIYNEDFPPINGFSPASTWHTIKGAKLPQSIWYEFPEALEIVMFSFQSRTEWTTASMIGSGASKYVFWGSNAIDCKKEEGRVVLVEDSSGTPFTAENTPKLEHVGTPSSYRCYGFTIKETPSGSAASMSNIRLWYNNGHGAPATEIGDDGSEIPLDLHEVDFVNSGGSAFASSHTVWKSGQLEPMNAFDKSTFWHSGPHSRSPDKYNVPQTLGFKFIEPIRVVKYSFSSRNDNITNHDVLDGPSKYIFWASNTDNCNDETHWTILKKDDSGTTFTESLKTKTEDIQNNQFYRCYGFKVTDVPGREDGNKVVTIGNVHFYSKPDFWASIGDYDDYDDYDYYY